MITINKTSYFANFEQVKKCRLPLLTLSIGYAILINFYIFRSNFIYLSFIHMLNQDKLDYSLPIFLALCMNKKKTLFTGGALMVA